MTPIGRNNQFLPDLFESLTDEMIFPILSHLPPNQMLSLRPVNRRFCHIVHGQLNHVTVVELAKSVNNLYVYALFLINEEQSVIDDFRICHYMSLAKQNRTFLLTIPSSCEETLLELVQNPTFFTLENPSLQDEIFNHACKRGLIEIAKLFIQYKKKQNLWWISLNRVFGLAIEHKQEKLISVCFDETLKLTRELRNTAPASGIHIVLDMGERVRSLINVFPHSVLIWEGIRKYTACLFETQTQSHLNKFLHAVNLCELWEEFACVAVKSAEFLMHGSLSKVTATFPPCEYPAINYLSYQTQVDVNVLINTCKLIGLGYQNIKLLLVNPHRDMNSHHMEMVQFEILNSATRELKINLEVECLASLSQVKDTVHIISSLDFSYFIVNAFSDLTEVTRFFPSDKSYYLSFDYCDYSVSTNGFKSIIFTECEREFSLLIKSLSAELKNSKQIRFACVHDLVAAYMWPQYLVEQLGFFVEALAHANLEKIKITLSLDGDNYFHAAIPEPSKIEQFLTLLFPKIKFEIELLDNYQDISKEQDIILLTSYDSPDEKIRWVRQNYPHAIQYYMCENFEERWSGVWRWSERTYVDCLTSGHHDKIDSLMTAQEKRW